MTKHTINLLGGLVVTLILVAGVLLGVLPGWGRAGQHDQDRAQVAARNQTQQVLIDAYAAQRAKLPELQAQVAALKQQIADGPHLEQLIDVASHLPSGAVLRSITPQDGATAQAAPVAPATPSTTASPGATGGAFQEFPVTMVIDLRGTSDAPAVLDRLRAGPRLLAMDHVTLAQTAASETHSGGATLTIDGRVFIDQEGAQ